MNLSLIRNWITYWLERLPIAAYILLSLGLALSPKALNFHLHLPQGPLATFVAALGIFYSLSLLRLMDDVKDLQKDVQAHPNRALARGLIAPKQAQNMVTIMSLGMLVIAFLLAAGGYAMAGFFYLLIAGYKWLMYREFYGIKLTQAPLAYALSHELILWPTCGFSFALAGPLDLALLTWFSLMMLGAFFCYEMCRKLQPNAPKALGYYRGLYGLKNTLLLACGALALVALGSWHCHLAAFSWPLIIVCLAYFAYVNQKPAEYKKAELVASLSLLLHTWIAPILTLWTTL